MASGVGEFASTSIVSSGNTALTTTVGNGTTVLNTAGVGVVAGTQIATSAAVNKAMGNPSGFSWRNAAAQIGASMIAASAGYEDPKLQASFDPKTFTKSFFGEIGNAGLRYGMTKAFGGNAHWDFKKVAADAFGTALGNSIVRVITQRDIEVRKAQYASAAMSNFAKVSTSDPVHHRQITGDDVATYNQYVSVFVQRGKMEQEGAEDLAVEIMEDRYGGNPVSYRKDLFGRVLQGMGANKDEANQVLGGNHVKSILASTGNVIDKFAEFNSSQFFALSETDKGGRYQKIVGGQYANRPGEYLAGRAAKEEGFLATMIQTAAPVLVAANDGFETIAEILDNPIAQYTLMGISLAAGPVRFLLSMAIEESPFGQYMKSNMALAHEKFTGYVASTGGIEQETAIKATAGALGLMTLMMSAKYIPQGLKTLQSSVGNLMDKHRRRPKGAEELNQYSKGESETGSGKKTLSSIALTKPSLKPGGKPKGNYETTDPRHKERHRALNRQNETADLFAEKGYDTTMLPETVGGNGYGINPGANPDLLIEGHAFDVYSPATPNIRNIWKTVEVKSETQASRIALNLDDFTGDMSKLLQQFHKWDIDGLDEIFFVRNGEITRVLPK